MVTITNSQEWLDSLEHCTIEDMYNLYESIIGVTQLGGFTCLHKKGILYIQTDDHGKVLVLINGKAVKMFLDKLDKDHGGDLGWVGGHFHVFRNAARNSLM